jgi:hypothetical protein
MAFKHRDIGMPPHLLIKCLLNRSSGGIGHVDDAPVAVTAFARQVIARFGSGERNALRDKPVDRLATMFDDETGCDRVAQTGAGGERILDVRLDRVGIIEYRSDAALSPGSRQFLDCPLGDKRNAVCVGKPQRNGLAGQTAAEHQDVERFQEVGSHVGRKYSTAQSRAGT